ncbi:hypothetical protein B0T14DRAFT_94823 [Immersiella caudata]|uniref:Uncharacterized protein n=1 Tax=Immersiella caudata TaxID=314043 RepID=A0AA40C5F9_9PEZI|nr:hypothetical protein B0T14DRAFT_94823 [Immersiella caudata]
MPVSDRMTWDATADQTLLCCVIESLNPTGDQLRQIQSKMTDRGYNCSVKAVSQHLQKLRRKEGAGAVSRDSGEGSSSAAATPKTPAGRKRAAPGSAGKKTPTSARGKKTKSEVVNAFMAGNNTASALDDEEDDDIDLNGGAGPSKKKVKREPKSKVKVEESDDEAVSIVKKEKGADSDKRGGNEDDAIIV